MKAAKLIQEAYANGLRLFIQNGKLRFRGSKRSASREILQAIGENKAEVIALLSHANPATVGAGTADPMARAHDRYQEAVAEVAAAYDAVKAAGRELPWLDPAIEAQLDEAIAARFRAGDPKGAIRSIEWWRVTWLELLNPQEAAARRMDANQLFDLVHDPSVPEADREVYRAEVLRRADAMIEESEGRRPHPNQVVFDMFERHAGGRCAEPEGGAPKK